MSGGTRFLLTQSLLSAWLYQYQAWDKDGAHKDFLRALGRQHTPETQAIRDGIQFENLVQKVRVTANGSLEFCLYGGIKLEKERT